MTTVDFPFAVDKDGTLTEARFRYTIRTARELERSAGTGIAYVAARGQSVEALVLLVCYGLKWQDKKMTEDKAVDLLDQFLDAGGDTVALAKACHEALAISGVYGLPKDGDGPLKQTTPTVTP